MRFARPLALVALALLLPPPAAHAQRGGGGSLVNGRSHGGEELACDYPPHEWFKNVGGRDGAGMCVFTSIEFAARWQGLEQMRGWRDWCAARYPGGGYPSKVDKLIADWCKAKNIAVPPYLQYEGPNPEQVLELADKTGRMSAITYGYSPRYGHTIAHMTACPKYSGKFGVCLDNNAIGGVNPPDALFEWMPKEELLRRIKHPGGSGWVFVWLAPPPPPVPHNGRPQEPLP